MGVIKFLYASRSVLLLVWWEYLLLVGFKYGEYYIKKKKNPKRWVEIRLNSWLCVGENDHLRVTLGVYVKEM